MNKNEDLPVVIDFGSYNTRAGFAGEDAPRTAFPSVCGHVKHQGIMIGSSQNDKFIGDFAISRRGTLNLKYLDSRTIGSYDDLPELISHIVNQDLKVNPQEHPFLLSESLLICKSAREKLAQIMFETFGVPAISLVNQPKLALLASGLTTGIVVDSGQLSTYVVPIVEGQVNKKAIKDLDIGGNDVNCYLQKILNENGLTLNLGDTIRDIKEKRCFVAKDYLKELADYNKNPYEIEMSYQLPDGKQCRLGTERFRAAEILFQPKLYGYDSLGIHELVYHSLNECDPKIRANILGKIVMNGGNTLFPGIDERLKAEIQKFNLIPSIVASPKMNMYATWIGGSIFSSLGSFKENSLSLYEYDEYGPGRLHEKCK